MKDVEAHPLTWPHGQKRTSQSERKEARFGQGKPGYGRKPVSVAFARDGILHELLLMAVDFDTIIISTNIPLRADGLPRGDWEGRRPADPGAAVYFTRKKRPIVIANDQYLRVEDNLRAIQKTLEAMRGIERWGSREILDQAFVGFTALPAPPKERPWREVLEYPASAPSQELILARYRVLAQKHHPDRGGDPAKMSELNRAREQALEEVG